MKPRASKRVLKQPRRTHHPLSFDTSLSLPKARDPYRSELQLPSHPPQVKGASAEKLAMDDGGFPGPNWEWGNAGAFGAFGLYFPGFQVLSEIAQRTEYRQPAETIAKEATRRWIIFKSKGSGDKTEKIAELEDEFERFKIRQHFRKVALHDGLFGGAFVYIDIKGQENQRALPLVVDEKTVKVGMLNGFTVVEPIWVTPIWWNSTDPTAQWYYRPKRWVVLNRETHASRLMTFFSREVPDYIKPAYNFLGVSLSQLIRPYVDRWLSTVSGVNRLINNFSIINFCTDMAAMLQDDRTGQSLIKRMQDFTEKRDNQGLFLTDKNIEELKQLTVSLTSLDHLQAQAQEHMAMPTHIPLVVLTGVTPSGLNASSDSEIEVWHDWVMGYQEELFTDHLTTVLQLIQLNKWGAVDPDIVFDYVPLKELDGEALARVRKSDGQAAIDYIAAGVIDPAEERQRLAHDPNSAYTNLDPDKVPEPPAQIDEPAGGGEEDDSAEAA